MKFISCFSGIEAASVASAKLGWEPVAFSEIDTFASSVLAHHFPHVTNHGDITKVNWSDYAGTVGLVCGGSPCQAFSVAGLRKSLEDPRGNLTIEYMRAVHAIKPTWVMWENVPGTFSAAGNPFGCFVAGLAGYDTPIEPPNAKWGNGGFLVAKDEESYSLAWRVLDAQYFGVPQRRRRIFLVGHLGRGSWWKPLEVLFERYGQGRDSAQGGEARKEVAADAGRCFATIDGQASKGNCNVKVYDMKQHHNPQQSDTVGLTTNNCAFVRGDSPLVMAHGQGGAEIREGQAPCLTCNHEAPILFEQKSIACGYDGDVLGDRVGTMRTGEGHATDTSHYVMTQYGPIAGTLTARHDSSPCADRGSNVAPTLARMHGHDMHAVAIRTAQTGSNGHGIDDKVAYTLDRANGQAVAIGSHWDNPTNPHPTLNQSNNIGGIGASNQEIFSQRGAGLVRSMAFAQNQEGELRTSATMNTLGTTQNASGRATGKIIQGCTVRRLTPTECERLQGFPDSWTRIPYRGKPAELCPDGPRYKALGNSWAVPVARWVFDRIDKVNEL